MLAFEGCSPGKSGKPLDVVSANRPAKSSPIAAKLVMCLHVSLRKTKKYSKTAGSAAAPLPNDGEVNPYAYARRADSVRKTSIQKTQCGTPLLVLPIMITGYTLDTHWKCRCRCGSLSRRGKGRANLRARDRAASRRCLRSMCTGRVEGPDSLGHSRWTG